MSSSSSSQMILRHLVKGRCVRPSSSSIVIPRRFVSSSSSTISSPLLSSLNNTLSPYQRETNYNKNYLQLPRALSFSTSSSSSSKDDETPETKNDETTTPPPPSETPSVDEPPPAPAEQMEFQAETRQLLDIVTHSLYTDKEVFLRELVSNASDALEKLRHVRAASEDGAVVVDKDIPLEIHIETDEANSTLTISDTGIGMTKDDMISNLGTIARSGSKAFVKELNEDKTTPVSSSSSTGDVKNIIGKFGVGFYSAFMVGKQVDVRSKSAYSSHSSQPPQIWSSTGLGSYSITTLPSTIRQNRGSSIVIHLKETEIEYATEKRIEGILKKYSNFVSHPIYLNGSRVNTMEALWNEPPNAVSAEKYGEFYKFVASAYDEPMATLHFRADAPIDIKALFFVPSFHTEKHGMGRMEPGVSLYSRKVLIEQKSPDILPDWLRFVKGVVDSEDLPLSISREKPQDTALIKRLKVALTRKFISYLGTMARKEGTRYKDEFYREYGYFLKEGICQDHEFQEPLSKLLYFETNKTMNGELTSLEEYVSRCKPDQNEIYYLCAPNRQLALDSPYLEAFDESDKEVIFIYAAIDDFVMSNLQKFKDRPLTSAESSNIDFSKDDNDDDSDEKDDDKSSSSPLTTPLSPTAASSLCRWFEETYPTKIKKCQTTTRLRTSPAVITDHESGQLRRMMKMIATEDGATPLGDAHPLSKQTMEINPKHEIVIGLYYLKETEPTLAKVVGEQMFDNCLVAAGLMDDGRSMLPRLNDLLLSVLNGANMNDEGEVKTMPKQDEVVAEVVDDGGVGAKAEMGASDDWGDEMVKDATFKEKMTTGEEEKGEKI